MASPQLPPGGPVSHTPGEETRSDDPSTGFGADGSTASFGSAEQTASLCEDQCRRWEAGERMRVEDYLVRHPQLRDRPADLVALILNEIRLRRQRGESAPEEEYQARFPEHAGALQVERLVRQGQGADASAPATPASAGVVEALYPKERFPDGHPDVVICLNNLGLLLYARGKPARAQDYLETAVAMQQRLAEGFSELASEAEVLDFLASLPLCRNAYLSFSARHDSGDGRVYSHLWRFKGTLLRALARRRFLLQQAHDRDSERLVRQWLDTRRQLSELTLAPLGKEGDAKERQRQLEECGRRKEGIERRLAERLPRLKERSTPPRHEDLRRRLPDDGALIDLFGYRAFEARPGERQGYRYAAFVLRKDRLVRRVELGEAGPIEAALGDWRQALAAQDRRADDSPSAAAGRRRADEAAARLRRLLWEPLVAHLGTVRQVWVCPEGPLAALPFAALPGSKAGTVLLEEHTLAILPHPSALLDWLEQPPRSGAGRLLLVGGVDYGPPGKPWAPLPASRRERDELAGLAREQAGSLRVVTLGGAEADAQSVVEQLRRSRLAHLATHGYFAAEDSKERERLYQQADLGRMGWGERVGTAARNPLTLSGLVLAGANQGQGKGLLTAEALAGEDLSGLQLAVLSACQTGLGEAAGGEGVFGLQRALHLAGARNVVAALWRVDDEATAALMALFYRNLWQHKLPAAKALRQAQLTLYRHPESVTGLARGRGPDFDAEFERVSPREPGKAEPEAPGKKGGRLPAKYWAGFVLSGPGR